MTRLHEKAQARTKQVIGQMIGDEKLVLEGKAEEKHANEKGPAPAQRDSKRREERHRHGPGKPQ
jgi:hypothetical protein